MEKLKAVILNKLPRQYENIKKVSATLDLKLLSIHDKNDTLHIFCVKNTSNVLSISNTETFAWQEDNYYSNEYRLLTIDKHHETCYYVILVKSVDDQNIVLEVKSVTRWYLKEAFPNFHELAKQLNDIPSCEILQFEAKEAVFLFDKKIVASFFLSPYNDPQIMSISDISDGNVFYRKVILLKEIIFALDSSGTKLYIYSFANNTKIYETELSDHSIRHSDGIAVLDFSINLNMDLIVFVTENKRIYTMLLNLSDINNTTKSNSFIPRTVTAFTKQVPSVRRVGDSLRRHSISSGYIQRIYLTCSTLDLVLEKILLLENKLFFLYQGHEESLLGIHMLDTDEPTLYKRLPHHTFFINSAPEEITSPLLLFFDNKIAFLQYNVDQDKLVNELMMYPSSSTVETLAAFNDWSSIQMDIEVLKSGLNNRKVYTVELYLKTVFDGFNQSWNAPTSSKWFEKVQKECDNWEGILNLVLQNVKGNFAENISYQYAQQLLHIVINMVLRIVDIIGSKASHETFFLPSDKNALLTKFTHLLLEMRKLVREQEKISIDSFYEMKPVVSTVKLKSEASDYWTKWENVLPEDIIQESILTGTVPLAQSYFYCCLVDADPTFHQFEQASENLVLYFLRQGLMSEALSILLNMGIDINSELLKIFKSTSEKDIRSLLLNELQERNLLSSSDLELLKFVALIEKLYPCTSFEHARMLLDEKSAISVNEMNCSVPYTEGKLPVGDIVVLNQDNSESGAYCRLILDWVSSWDYDVKSRILAPHFLKNSPVLDFFYKEGTIVEIDPMSLWCYLLENGCLPYLTNWIETWLSCERKSDCSSIFKNWQITDDMINAIPERATLYISEILLNKLAKQGVFCEEELEDISLFLTRINRSQCDVNDASIFSASKACVTFPDLMHRLVHYSLKNNLIRLLYFLFSSNYKKFTIWPSCSLCNVLELNLTKAFYLWSLNHKDSHLAYDAVAELAQYIFNLRSTTTMDLLSDLPLPLCLSIFLLKSQPLAKTVHEMIANSGIKGQTVKDKFLPHPLLYNALFKRSEQSHPDITVYELLKGNTVFDTTQLFGWQASNTLKSEDSLNELPHFSLKSLSEQYGLKKQLNYIYYLLQKRPNYAYLKFVQEEVSSGSGLSISRIKSACSDVADFAIENYRNPEVSLSCILFTELAGKDSLPLRACLVAANILHENMTRNLSSGEDFDKSFPEIRKMFKLAVVSKDAALNLITELESIAIQSWDAYYAGSDSLVKDICLWMPVMILSRLYGIEIGSLYLNECAKQNKWLKFLVFAQIFQLSKEQVLKSASRFSNSCIYYHIFHAIQKKSFIQNVSVEGKKAITAKASKKDMRKSLYTRIGVLKNAPSDTKSSSELDDDQMSVSSIETATSSSSSEADSGSFVLKDLFSQLLLANNSDVPWESLLHASFAIKNPVLAVLASSYPESPFQSCFYTWLYTALCHDEDCKKYIESRFHCRVTSISTDDIENIMLFAIQKKKILLLWQGVEFYIPTTPLMPLMEFLKDFLVFKKFTSSLEIFLNQLWDYPKSSEHPSVIHSALWLENVSVSILKECVVTCSTNYERLILLRHFSHTRIEKSFSKQVIVPSFMKVYHMLEYTGDIEENIDVQTLFLPEDDLNYKNTCWTIVKKLLQLHLFHEAEMFATAARLPLDDLFLFQMNETVSEARKNANWSNLSHRIQFWKPIFDKLSSTIIPIQAAVEFLENQCAISDMYGEKYFLMKFIINLLSMPSTRTEMAEGKSYNIEALQRKMWLWCVKAQVKNEIFTEIFDDDSSHEFDFEVDSYPIVNTTCVFENSEEKEALQYLISQLLSNKDFKKAFELSSIFGFKSQDLEVIYTCLKLAKGEVDVSSVDLSIPDCCTEVSTSRFIRSLILWLSSSSAVIATQQKDVMMCIEALGRKCETAISICHQILVDFVVATILKKSYVDVVKEKDALFTLKQILVKRLNDEHILAKCFIIVHDLPDRNVAIFLSEEIWTSLQCFVISELVLLPEGQLTTSEELIYDPSSTKESFQLVVKLCQDPSVLGKILMDTFARETTELSSKSSDKTFSCIIELCICAHECFTAACNMEGISQILHNSYLLVSLLEEAKKFNIMVRLLIGLGRYSEMIYVFDILKNHEKFSLLFVKKLENTPNLKLALLDYLKRLPPSEADNYFYTITETLGMYREKAEILEMSVQKKLSQLCKKSLDIDMKDELDNAMQDLAEAAKSYCKADCLYQAQNCTRLAQLIALQVYFLIDSGIWIIGLDEASVSRFIIDHDKFFQSFIVAEYYGNHQLWSQAVLNNTVLRGNREYLQHYRAQFGLSTTLITDVVKRYQKLTSKHENSTKHIKFLLNLCPNIKVKYSLALELGFSDMASELFMGEGAPYLQDLIANNVIKMS